MNCSTIQQSYFEHIPNNFCPGSYWVRSYDKEVITRLFSYQHLYQALGRQQSSTSSRAVIDARARYTGWYENSRMITSKTSSFHNYITFYVVGIERSINNTIVRDCVAMPDEMAARWMTGVQLIRTYSPDGGNDRCPPSVETPVQLFAVCWPKFSSLNVTKLSASSCNWGERSYNQSFFDRQLVCFDR